MILKAPGSMADVALAKWRRCQPTLVSAFLAALVFGQIAACGKALKDESTGKKDASTSDDPDAGADGGAADGGSADGGAADGGSEDIAGGDTGDGGTDGFGSCATVALGSIDLEDCETLVAEKWPMGITVTCEVKGNGACTSELRLDYQPVDATKIKIEIDGKEYPSGSYDALNNSISLGGLEKLGGEFVLKVQYDSTKKFEETGALGQLTYGKVRNASGLDGCNWLIDVGKDQVLEPLNLPEAFQKDGAEILFRWKPPETDVASICMAGQLATVSEVQVAATTNGTTP